VSIKLEARGFTEHEDFTLFFLLLIFGKYHKKKTKENDAFDALTIIKTRVAETNRCSV
jgi:hypothetical protein